MRQYKNKHKRDYYIAYREYVLNHETGEEPNRAPLSPMGAQAVQRDVRSDISTAQNKPQRKIEQWADMFQFEEDIFGIETEPKH